MPYHSFVLPKVGSQQVDYIALVVAKEEILNHLPSPNLIRFILKSLVELLADQMSALADNQSSIVWSVGQQVDKSLKASETRLLWVLILMWPWLVGLEIGTSWERPVYAIKGNDEIFSVVHFFEGIHNSWLGADVPGELLVCDTISQAHSFLGDDRQVILVEGRGVVTFEAEAAIANVSIPCVSIRAVEV